MLDVATLLERCRGGDDLAWEALVREYQGRVFAVALHYLRNREEARDVAQDIFIRIYRRLDSFHGEERFLPWMLRLARNCCIDRLRRLKARTPPGGVALDIDEGPEIPDHAPAADETAGANEAKQLLHRAIGRLSDKNREIILLKEIQGLTFEEISTMLELPVGTVKSRSNRARVELARKVRTIDPSYGV